MTGRPYLRLVTDDMPLAAVTPVSPTRLVAAVVEMARRWAAESDRVGAIGEVSTAEERARRDLADAVHDMEYHQAAPGLFRQDVR